MDRPINTLHVLSRMSRGGAEVRTMEILRHVDRRRYRFHFCTLSGLPGELDDEIRDLGGEIHPLRLSSVAFPRRFGKLLRQHRFDVVCSHVLYGAGFILRLAARNKTPVRVAFFRSSHDGHGFGPARRVYRKLMHRWIDRYATHIVGVSRGVMAGVWGPDWEEDPRCQVIYDGIEPAPFAEQTQDDEVRREFGVPRDVPLYIHVGHLRAPKNHLRLMEIFAEMRRRQPAARLLLVGEGEDRIERRVRQRAAELQIDGNVVFCRQRTDVPRLLQAADVLIFPSLWEGLPGAVLEACAAGTPVLASDLPGVREIARRLPQVQCLSLEAENAEWARVVEGMRQTRDAGTTRQEVRRSFAESVFTIDHCAQRHRRVWEGLAREPREGANSTRFANRAPRPPKPLAVLHLHGRMARGGAEMRTLDILRHIDRRRYQFHFCCLSGQAGELDDEIRDLGGHVHRMRQSRAGFPRKFRELLHQRQIDVVHSHLFFYSGYLLKLAAECGVGVRVAHFRTSRADQITTARRILHGLMSLGIERYAGQSTMRRWMDRHATDILGVSQFALSSAWGPGWADDPRCRVVYDGIEPTPYRAGLDTGTVRREFGLPDDADLFVHVGRFTEAKNHLRLISIFAEILRRRPEARLLLIGRTVAGSGRDDPIEGRVRQRIARLGIADRVVFAGERGDVPRLMLAGDALIFPSLWEGLGDVVLEARAAGTPVLASDLPSIGEIADRLPGVRRMSLTQSDAAWARAALETADNRPSIAQRRAAWESFGNSVFTVGHCTETLRRIWRTADG